MAAPTAVCRNNAGCSEGVAEEGTRRRARGAAGARRGVQGRYGARMAGEDAADTTTAVGAALAAAARTDSTAEARRIPSVAASGSR